MDRHISIHVQANFIFQGATPPVTKSLNSIKGKYAKIIVKKMEKAQVTTLFHHLVLEKS